MELPTGSETKGKLEGSVVCLQYNTMGEEDVKKLRVRESRYGVLDKALHCIAWRYEIDVGKGNRVVRTTGHLALENLITGKRNDRQPA
jgi:hypothetical protein